VIGRAGLKSDEATAAGARIFGEVHRLTSQMLAGLDAAELVITDRVLATITQRANEILAG